MTLTKEAYPARLDIDYVEKHNRKTTFLRIVWSLPILVLLTILTSTGSENSKHEFGRHVSANGGGIVAGLVIATALMILFRQRYPRWWFDFSVELKRFSTRVGSYVLLLTDSYPSTTDKQSVNLDFDYPNAGKDLNRWLPLVKWFLAIPHYAVLFVLIIAAIISTVFAWLSILFTGRYPKSLFDFVVGVMRWSTRVEAYAFMLVTDKYPPFSLK